MSITQRYVWYSWLAYNGTQPVFKHITEHYDTVYLDHDLEVTGSNLSLPSLNNIVDTDITDIEKEW